jgi:ubiquitin-protein ligase
MSDQRTRRVLREMDDMHSDNSSGVTLEPVGDSICKPPSTNKQTLICAAHLRGRFKGPVMTPYEGTSPQRTPALGPWWYSC